jgi:multidrug resistance efflux pump
VQIETVVTAKTISSQLPEADLVVSDKIQISTSWEGNASFQASGWIEPSPFPVKVSALVDGFIDEVLVLEGEAVKRGQVMARLVREDFELDLATAQGELDSLRAEADANEKAILSVAAQVTTLEKQVNAGKLRLLELEDTRNRLGRLASGAASEEEIIQSSLRVQTYQGELEALEISGVELESEEARLIAMRASFQAKIRSGETEVARRQLALDRTEIRAPIDGIVLRLFAMPGRKSMLSMDDMDSSTIATLYRPDSLQARIDVPLEEATAVFPGQAVRIRSNFLPDQVMQGVVSRITGEADLQRNTLQVKVDLKNPDLRLRPEMLCRAEFLQESADGNPAGEAPRVEGDRSVSNRDGRTSVYVSLRALLEVEDEIARVWVIARSGEHIESRNLVRGTEERDGYRIVREGLLPGDQVVLDPDPNLAEGARIKSLPESDQTTK